MQAFAFLFEQLDQTTATNEKVRIMTEFFRQRDPDTSAWVLFFLSGQGRNRSSGLPSCGVGRKRRSDIPIG